LLEKLWNTMLSALRLARHGTARHTFVSERDEQEARVFLRRDWLQDVRQCVINYSGYDSSLRHCNRASSHEQEASLVIGSKTCGGVIPLCDL